SAEFGLNCGQYALQIAENVVVPESKYSISFSDQVIVADRVSCRLRMLPTIDLNHDLLLATDEIADVSANRHLSCKFVAVDLAIADAIPKDSFRVRLIGT